MAAELNHTVKPSGGDYATLAEAIAHIVAAHADLVSADVYATIEISGDWSAGADTTAVVIPETIITDATHYLSIYTDAANRASLAWDASKYRLSVADPGIYHGVVDLDSINYVRLDGIQMDITASAGNYRHCINIVGANRTSGANGTWISRCLLKGVGGTTRMYCYGIYSYGTYTNTYLWNSGIYNIRTEGTCYGIWSRAGSSFTVGSTTIIGGRYGLYRSAATCVAKNVYAGGSSEGDYYGTITKTTCASSDTTGDTGLTEIPVSTATFVSVTEGSEDFHLAAGSALIGTGTTTSGDGAPMNFTDDMDGDTRS